MWVTMRTIRPGYQLSEPLSLALRFRPNDFEPVAFVPVAEESSESGLELAIEHQEEKFRRAWQRRKTYDGTHEWRRYERPATIARRLHLEPVHGKRIGQIELRNRTIKHSNFLTDTKARQQLEYLVETEVPIESRNGAASLNKGQLHTNQLLEFYGFDDREKTLLIRAYGIDSVRAGLQSLNESRKVPTKQSLVRDIDDIAQQRYGPSTNGIPLDECTLQARTYFRQRYFAGINVELPPPLKIQYPVMEPKLNFRMDPKIMEDYTPQEALAIQLRLNREGFNLRDMVNLGRFVFEPKSNQLYFLANQVEALLIEKNLQLSDFLSAENVSEFRYVPSPEGVFTIVALEATRQPSFKLGPTKKGLDQKVLNNLYNYVKYA